MRTPRLSIAVALLALALAAPGTAWAQEDAPLITPPGNSAVEQYKETLPAPGGGRTTDSGRDVPPSKVLGERNAQRLERFGEVGEAAAELAAQTAPGAAALAGGRAAAGESGAGGAGGSRSGLAAADSGGSPLAQIAGQATGADAEGGIGWLLPLIVALAVVGGIAYAAGRRRARGTGS